LAVLIRSAAVLALVVGAVLRLREVDAIMVLADGMGPYLTATASPVNPHPHAPPYGWALYVPYALCLALAQSLRSAAVLMALLHALAAPLAALSAGRLGGVGAAVVAGMLVAVDPGLLDTLTSGAETYLAPVWIGLLTWLSLTAKSQPKYAVLLGPVWACAVMNHPLALCTLPLLGLAGRNKRSLAGLMVGCLMLAPTVLGWWQSGGTGLDDGSPLQALPAWLAQGGPVAGLLAVSALVGLGSRRTRRLSIAVLSSALLLGLAGTGLGYLRDHHIRLLTVPLAVCVAGFGARWVWLGLLCLRWPASHVPPSDKPHRPGTLGLATELTTVISALPPPILVDGAWLSGTAAAEPSAVLLDLHLRGIPVGPGGSLVVIVSYRRGQQPPWNRSWRRGDRYFMVTERHSELAASICGNARLGGAWDGLAVLRPDTTLQQARAWWADCEQP
jgi:hypothetical protein